MLTSAIALAALAASAIPAALGQATYCDGNTFCAIGGVDADGEVIVTIQSSATGWVAFGTGTRMAGASIYAGWRNSNGGVTFSPRQATGHSLPPVSSEGIARLVATPAGIARPSWANIMYTFKRPVSGINRMASGSYIYAYSNVAPSSPDSPSSSFTRHADHNSFSLDLSTVIGGAPASPAVPSSSPLLLLFLPASPSTDASSPAPGGTAPTASAAVGSATAAATASATASPTAAARSDAASMSAGVSGILASFAMALFL
ncbi:hypothetical protein BC831DRAFT_475429 [Entophlyctis helioformis]|nr:hypothetical protein BC831DRAFT_475429 [Entophlyctis helioformis]